MIWIRKRRRSVGLLAAVLLALQPLLSLASSAIASPSTGLKKVTEMVVICSEHGTMTIEVEEDAPVPGQQPSRCPYCISGCAAGSALAAPLPSSDGALWRPAADVIDFAPPRANSRSERLALHYATSPRGPPPQLA